MAIERFIWIHHADGRHFVIAYDHPHRADHAAVRIVSVWDF